MNLRNGIPFCLALLLLTASCTRSNTTLASPEIGKDSLAIVARATRFYRGELGDSLSDFPVEFLQYSKGVLVRIKPDSRALVARGSLPLDGEMVLWIRTNGEIVRIGDTFNPLYKIPNEGGQ